jgi:hypothetical protein
VGAFDVSQPYGPPCPVTRIDLFLSHKATAQIGTKVRVRVFNAGLLPGSGFASGRSGEQSTRSRVFVVFLGSTAKAGAVPKFRVILASHAALPLLDQLRSNAVLPKLISKLIPFTRSKVPALYKVHFLTLYLLLFPKLYRISDVPLPEGRMRTAWKLSKQERLLSSLS